MKKIITSGITTAVGMPIKSGTVEHLQAAYQEALTALARMNILSYDASKIYVLYGCVNSGSGANFVISAGAVFFNGEVYLVPSATFTTSGGNVAIGTVTTTYFTATNADPVEFTDAILRSVHEIRQIVISSGTSGATNYADFVFTNGGRVQSSDTSKVTVVFGAGTVNSFNFSYFKVNGVVTYSFNMGITCTANTNLWSFDIVLPYPADLVADTLDTVQSAGGMKNGNFYHLSRNSISANTPSILNIVTQTDTTAGSRQFWGQITYKAI